MTDRNRDFSEAARGEAAKLDALFAELADDVGKLEAQLLKMGFGKDSIGSRRAC